MFALQGHRGARGLFPENTLAGFAGAIAIGVTALELDVAVTRDGVPVVIHDLTLHPDLTRDASGRWLEGEGPLLRALTLDQVRGYDIGRARPGSEIAIGFPDQLACDGARVPTLAEVLALAARHGVRVEAELKTDPQRPDATLSPAALAELVVGTAAEQGALALLRVRAFDWRGLRHLRVVHPELPLAWLTDAGTERDPAQWWADAQDVSIDVSTPAAVAAAAGMPPWPAVWAPDYRGLTAWRIGEAHALGLLVVPWTVNTIEAMAMLLALGADGLCTDRPDLARQAMAAFGLELPSPPVTPL